MIGTGKEQRDNLRELVGRFRATVCARHDHSVESISMTLSGFHMDGSFDRHRA